MTLLDQKLFFKINQVWTHSKLDILFVHLTDFTKTPYFYILFFLILIALYRRYGWKAFAVVVGAAALSSLADGASSELLKTWIARPRPEFANLPFEVILRRPSEGSFSFPSSHALDAFVVASFIFSFSKTWGAPLLVLASLVAYSRVYCGLHFPLDVVGGAILGGIIGFSFGKFTSWWVHREK